MSRAPVEHFNCFQSGCSLGGRTINATPSQNLRGSRSKIFKVLTPLIQINLNFERGQWELSAALYIHHERAHTLR
jgi:hypothetical protein